MKVSGKLVIIAILAIALAAAGASWWFRYSATHRAADFWGAYVARLIRDAPTVEFYAQLPAIALLNPSDQEGQLDQVDFLAKDISRARGLLHLRNALLEDRSFDWPPKPIINVGGDDGDWGYILIFRERASGTATYLLFSSDLKVVATLEPARSQMLSCRPITRGLREIFAQLTESQAANSTSFHVAPAR